MKKQNIISIFLLLLIAILGASFSLFYPLKKEFYLAVIPHFMIQSLKVDNFYSFLKDSYFVSSMPDTIVLISPNHFFQKQKNIEGLCSETLLHYKNEILTGYDLKDDNIVCDGGVFYYRGESLYVKDHGLGAHFQWFNKYFPDVKVIPLVLPSHDMKLSEKLVEKLKKFNGTTLIIASVDFSHYQSEVIAEKNDEISFSTLDSYDKFSQIRQLDVDCPACLGVVYLFAKDEGQKIQQRYRDSSSTIVGYDLEEDNTSRQFLFWKH